MERLRKVLDAKYIGAIDESINNQFNRFAKNIREHGTSAAMSMLGLEAWNTEMFKVFEKMYKEIVVTFGNATYRAIKIDANQKGETFGFNQQWTDEVMKFLTTQGFQLVSQITKTTRDKMIAIVTQGVQDGLGVEDIVKNVLADENLAYTLFRARRIVRTEVMRASNMGAMEGAKAHRFQVDKMWISAHDSRTRRIPADEFDHWEMDGVTIPLDQPFTSTGKKGEQVVAMQPGDLSAPAGFTINCRCTVGFVPKRDLNGRLIYK